MGNGARLINVMSIKGVMVFSLADRSFPGHVALTGNVQCRGQRNTYKEGHKIPLQIQALGGTVARSAVTEEAKGTPGEKADGNFPPLCREFPPSSEGIS
jgi:hypothetical protein